MRAVVGDIAPRDTSAWEVSRSLVLRIGPYSCSDGMQRPTRRSQLRAANAIVFVIHTERFDDSLTFYRDVLQLELVEEWHDAGHGAVIRLTGDADLELIELDVEPGAHGGVALGLEVDAVDAWYEQILERGGVVNAPPINAFGKRGFGVTDPNGVRVNIYTSDSYDDR